MMVIVDDREPPHIAEAFERLFSDANVIVHRLQHGDIRIGNLTIERKTAQDFIASWFNGRLQEQIAMLVAHTKRPILFVHDDPRSNLDDLTWQRLAERMKTINLALPAYYFRSLDEALTFFVNRVGFLRSGEWLQYVKRPVRVAEGSPDAVLELYVGLPHVGPDLAARLKAKFPTPQALTAAVASRDWHADIDGIGERKAACIVGVLLRGEHPSHKRVPLSRTTGDEPAAGTAPAGTAAGRTGHEEPPSAHREAPAPPDSAGHILDEEIGPFPETP